MIISNINALSKTTTQGGIMHQSVLSGIPKINDTKRFSMKQHAHLFSTEIKDPKTIDFLMLANVGLVIRICQRFYGYTKNNGVDFEDIFQIGMIGLHHAIMNFNLEYKTAFSTYAFLHIRKEINRWMETNERLVRWPSSIVEARMALKKQIRQQEQETSRIITPEEIEVIAKNISAKKHCSTQLILGQLTLSSSIELSLVNEASETSFHHYPQIAEEMDQQELLTTLKEAISKLPIDNQLVIKMRFGIDGPTCTYKEIAKRINKSTERVRQLIKISIAELRKNEALSKIVNELLL